MPSDPDSNASGLIIPHLRDVIWVRRKREGVYCSYTAPRARNSLATLPSRIIRRSLTGAFAYVAQIGTKVFIGNSTVLEETSEGFPTCRHRGTLLGFFFQPCHCLLLLAQLLPCNNCVDEGLKVDVGLGFTAQASQVVGEDVLCLCQQGHVAPGSTGVSTCSRDVLLGPLVVMATWQKWVRGSHVLALSLP